MTDTPLMIAIVSLSSHTPAWDGRYCGEDVDGCTNATCSEGVECTDIPAPGVGAMCGPNCLGGYSGDGSNCVGECP